MFKQHGESDMNVEGRIGGDSDLSYRGKLYATALANYIQQQDIPGLRVWTSWLKRTIQTVATIPAPQERWKALNEIDAVSINIFYQVYFCLLGLNLLLEPALKSLFQCLLDLPAALSSRVVISEYLWLPTDPVLKTSYSIAFFRIPDDG